ncbi:MAG: DUF2249 domain-containing protein [Actinobacteria bacterium]|nr:DUF2249 domain-containing protein [Actinomycetota bacterium]
MSTPSPRTIDVRHIPPAERHPMIHAELDALDPAATLVLVTDHRPLHLYQELETLRPGESTWDGADFDDGTWRTTFTKVARVLDVRPLIDAGEEPFETIMNTVGELDGEDLVIVAPFEPAPLEGVLSSQGFAFEANEVEPGHWRTRFSTEA